MKSGSGQMPCALCGTTVGDRVIDRAGCVCNVCLGAAVAQVVSGRGVRNLPTITAADRCLLCGETVVSGSVVAVRPPYHLCGTCIGAAAERALSGPADIVVQVDF